MPSQQSKKKNSKKPKVNQHNQISKLVVLWNRKLMKPKKSQLNETIQLNEAKPANHTDHSTKAAQLNK
jgi:hypothetical protein